MFKNSGKNGLTMLKLVLIVSVLAATALSGCTSPSQPTPGTTPSSAVSASSGGDLSGDIVGVWGVVSSYSNGVSVRVEFKNDGTVILGDPVSGTKGLDMDTGTYRFEKGKVVITYESGGKIRAALGKPAGETLTVKSHSRDGFVLMDTNGNTQTYTRMPE